VKASTVQDENDFLITENVQANSTIQVLEKRIESHEAGERYRNDDVLALIEIVKNFLRSATDDSHRNDFIESARRKCMTVRNVLSRAEFQGDVYPTREWQGFNETTIDAVTMLLLDDAIKKLN